MAPDLDPNLYLANVGGVGVELGNVGGTPPQTPPTAIRVIDTAMTDRRIVSPGNYRVIS